MGQSGTEDLSGKRSGDSPLYHRGVLQVKYGTPLFRPFQKLRVDTSLFFCLDEPLGDVLSSIIR